MSENIPHNHKEYRLRAKLPQFFRIFAVGAIVVTIFAVLVGFYRSRSNSPFKLRSEHAQLSTDVVAEVNGYERLETEGGFTKYFIKADYAKTFSDNHQELQNVYLEVYDKEGVSNDKMRAESALYIPEENKNFTAYLKGNVQIETHEALKIKTNNITYSKKTETADADEAVEFERENIRGKSFGATVKMGEKRLDLLKDVEIETFESAELAKSNVRYAKLNASSASFDQIANKIDLNNNVSINILSKAQASGKSTTTDIHSDRAVVNLAVGDSKSPQLKNFELFDHVNIISTEQGNAATNINAGYALYDKAADRYELKNNTHIVTTASEKQTDIKASEAIFDQGAHKLTLTGAAEIAQGGDYLKGDEVKANLFPDNKIKYAVISGNAFVRQTTSERTTTIAAPELNATFNDLRQLHDAKAIGASIAEIVPSDTKEYSRVTVNANRGIGILLKGEGLIDTIRTDGRTTIQLNAPNSSQEVANKRVTADSVTTFFNANGKDISKTEAVGNAELYVEPLIASIKTYRTTISAPRFDCEFFPTGNNARICIAGKKARAVRVPTVTAAGHGPQTLFADQLTANFSPRSNDVESLDATGNSKFTELDRNAISRQMTFTDADETVRLRGGEPTVWDSRARAKAGEIDLDVRNNHSYLQGGVSTTYYSQKQMKGSAPFGSSDKPVFVTSQTAEFDNVAETATFVTNARGWQDNNYVRGDKIFVDQSAGKFIAEGNVQSLLYNAKLRQKGKESTVPTSAAANSMIYDRDKRLLQYRTSVDIRQGTDRITAGSADVYLNESNEVSKTIAETNVVITQPARRATGDWAQYTAEDETAILRGNPAVVNDAENGSSQSGQLTFHMRDNRVESDGKSKQNTSGRTRSVYKVKPQ
ncbi:MAG: LPS export ABC transporter periplasmic protein LptC [Pyrinomonadaceae bacterium]